MERLGHQIAVVVNETVAAVEFVGAIAVVYFQVKEFGPAVARGSFGQVEELRADSLPTMGRFDEKLVDPSTLAAVFEAEVKTNNQVTHGGLLVADEINEATIGIVEELEEILADCSDIERFRPGIVGLHVAHEQEERVQVVGGRVLERNRHRKIVCSLNSLEALEDHRRGKIEPSGGDTVSTEAVASRRHAGGQPPVTGRKLELPTTTWHLLLN
jgi:hypothetical protein